MINAQTIPAQERQTTSPTSGTLWKVGGLSVAAGLSTWRSWLSFFCSSRLDWLFDEHCVPGSTALRRLCFPWHIMVSTMQSVRRSYRADHRRPFIRGWTNRTARLSPPFRSFYRHRLRSISRRFSFLPDYSHYSFTTHRFRPRPLCLSQHRCRQVLPLR